MITLIKKLFVKNYKETSLPEVRVRYGFVGGLVGIISNLVLFALKLAIGLITASVAIVADAMNNLSDAGSSLITLFGFKMSSRPADSEHPYGHARYEYVSGLIIAFLIIMIGVELGKSSVEKIINGDQSTFDWITVVILGVAVVIKIWQGMLYKNFGKAISSATLEAASQDSRNDVISTSAVLLSIIFTLITGITIDAYVGLAVSVFILLSSVSLLKETINPLLGTAPDKELVDKLVNKIRSYPEVLGLHDLVIHSYGAMLTFATVHAEVDAEKNVLDSHDTIDNIERDVKNTLGINLVIHLDPVVLDDEEANDLNVVMANLLKEEVDERITIHELRLVRGTTHTNVLFDIVLPFDCKMNEDEVKKVVDKKLATYDKVYFSVLNFDRDYNS